jgi:hypothetical protein
MRTRCKSITLLFALQLGGCASVESPKALVSVPDKLAPGAAETLSRVVPASGVQGAFNHVTSIQRVNTVGVVAPAAGCSSAAVGTTVRVHYTADYYFFSNQPTGRTNDQATRTPDQILDQSRTSEQYFQTQGNVPITR